VVIRMMSSPNRSTSNIEDAFSSINILNYTSVSPDYFPALNVQAFYAKELPISSKDSITPPAILTSSPVLPPSLLFDPRYFFVPEELLPPKKQIHSPSSSSTTLSNSSRNQTCDLISPSSSVYTPTPPQIFEIGKYSIKMYLKHHEKQIKDTLNYLDELFVHRIEKMEDEFYNLVVKGNDLKTYIRRFQELAVLCPNMVPNAEKLMEVFISGLPRSIKENVTASKPQIVEEAINIAQRLMAQIIK
ncbi:hypothetical protein Tco_0060999, partial [Tanacetum coccineum]